MSPIVGLQNKTKLESRNRRNKGTIKAWRIFPVWKVSLCGHNRWTLAFMKRYALNMVSLACYILSGTSTLHV